MRSKLLGSILTGALGVSISTGSSASVGLHFSALGLQAIPEAKKKEAPAERQTPPSSSVVDDTDEKEAEAQETVADEMKKAADDNEGASQASKFGAVVFNEGQTAHVAFRDRAASRPDFMGKNIKVAVSRSQEMVPEFTYSTYLSSFYSSISYTSRTINETGEYPIDETNFAGVNTKEDTLKLYPVSWSFSPTSATHFSTGFLLAQRRIDRQEINVIAFGQSSDTLDLSFQHTSKLHIAQYGGQASFLQKSPKVNFRGTLDFLPISQLTRTETEINLNGENSSSTINSQKKMGTSFGLRLEALFKLDASLDVLVSGIYDRLPIRYSRAAWVLRSINNDVSSLSSDYDIKEYDIRVINKILSVDMLLNTAVAGSMYPFIEYTWLLHTVDDKEASEQYSTKHSILNIGIRSRF